MSTVAVLNLTSSGKINPTLPLVAELVRRGEDVIYYSIERNRAAIEATGAEYRSYSHPQSMIPKAHQGALFGVMAYLAKAAEANMPALLQELQANPPDYLLLDSMSIWGNLIQQVLNIPAVTFSSTFLMPPTLPAQMILNMTYQNLPKAVMLHGLQGLHSYFETAQRLDRDYGTQSPNVVESFSNRQGLNLIFTSREFQPGSPMFKKEIYKFIGPSITKRAESVEFPFDQLGSKPILYISLGTINNQNADFYKDCYTAFGSRADQASPYQVIMSIGKQIDPATLGPTPDNFIVRPYVPQLEILQRVSLFITHGGMNSTSEALLYGVPLIVIPQRGDQFLVAQQVVESGAGLTLSTKQATPEILQQAATQILSNTKFKTQANVVSQSFKDAGGYVRGVDEILAYKQKC